MIAALLAVLGVDLIVILFLLAGMMGRKRWLKHQPGAFQGAIRVTDGEIDGLGDGWGRGYGRWVRDVLVWTKGPLLLRNVILPSDGLNDERSGSADQIKRLGEAPTVIALKSGAATIEVAAPGDDRALLVGSPGFSLTSSSSPTPSLGH